jgi:hypothetical protein
MHMHMPSRSELFLYTFTVPVVIVTAVLAVMSVISIVLWAVGTYQFPG